MAVRSPLEAPASVADTVRVHLLGGFRVVVAGRDVAADAWRLSKARALVTLLALAPGQALAREEVMDRLWPDRWNGLAPFDRSASASLCLRARAVPLSRRPTVAPAIPVEAGSAGAAV